MDGRHRVIELSGLLRVLRQVLEERRSVSELHGRRSGLDGSRELMERVHAPWVRAEVGGGLAERTQLEAAVGTLTEEPEPGQRAHHPVQGRLVQALRLRQLSAGLRAVEQPASDLVSTDDFEELGHDGTDVQTEDLHGRRWSRRHRVIGGCSRVGLRDAAHVGLCAAHWAA
jgi:hypothetical protein